MTDPEDFSDLFEGEVCEARQQECLVLALRLADDEFGTPFERDKWWMLEQFLSLWVRVTRCGEVDGNGIGMGFYEIFIYGRRARRLWVLCSAWVWVLWPRRGSYADLVLESGARMRREIRR